MKKGIGTHETDFRIKFDFTIVEFYLQSKKIFGNTVVQLWEVK